MNGNEFLKNLRRLSKKTGIAVEIDTSHGKGSHIRVYYGDSFTTLKDRKKEIKAGLFAAMLKQLGIDKDDF